MHVIPRELYWWYDMWYPNIAMQHNQACSMWGYSSGVKCSLRMRNVWGSNPHTSTFFCRFLFDPPSLACDLPMTIYYIQAYLKCSDVSFLPSLSVAKNDR